MNPHHTTRGETTGQMVDSNPEPSYCEAMNDTTVLPQESNGSLWLLLLATNWVY